MIMKVAVGVFLLYTSVVSSIEGFSWNKYYDIDAIVCYLDEMAAQFPNQAELIQGGSSYEGRKIMGLRISNNLSDKNRKIVMIESGIHAREWIDPAAATYFINQLLTSSDATIAALKNDVEWHIFPCVNPDGYHYSINKEKFWRKTRSLSASGCYGCDPNRNWDYNFGKFGANPDSCDYNQYNGAKPFSEIETKSLSEYITGISKRLVGYIGMHSPETTLYVPYGDSTEHIPDYDQMVKVGKVMIANAAKVNGTTYLGPATAAEISYPASGMSVDWVYKTFQPKLVYLLELRGDNFHWPASLITIQGDELTQMMLGMITEAKKLKIF